MVSSKVQDSLHSLSLSVEGDILHLQTISTELDGKQRNGWRLAEDKSKICRSGTCRHFLTLHHLGNVTAKKPKEGILLRVLLYLWHPNLLHVRRHFLLSMQEHVALRDEGRSDNEGDFDVPKA